MKIHTQQDRRAGVKSRRGQRRRHRRAKREYQKILCKVLLGNFQIQFSFLRKQTERERPVIEQRGGGEGSDYQWLVVVEIGSQTTTPQPIVGDEMSSERERENFLRVLI